MSHSFFSSLRFRLLLLVLIALIPALGLMLYSASVQRRETAAAVQADALRLVRLAASNQEQVIEGARQLLLMVAHLREVRGRDPAACNALAADLLSHNRSYVNLGAADLEGNVYCSAVPSAQRLTTTDRSWVERAAQTRDFTVGDYQVGSISGKALLVCAYPVLSATDQVQAVVFAALDLTWLNQLATEGQLPGGAALAVTDRRGTILARHPDPQQWVGKVLPDELLLLTMQAQTEGVAEVAGADGITRLYAFTALRGTPKAIHVSIGIPKKTALAGANRIFTRSLWGLALGGLLAMVAAWIIGDLVILRRVKVLAGAAERLSAGDLNARAALRGGDEIGAMAQAFNEMAQRLETMVGTELRAREALAEQVKQLVAERTREVELLNQMAEMLQACQSMEEAYSVVDELAGQIFGGDAGIVFILNAPRKILEVAAVWGRSPAGEREVFAPDECWALRRGRAHLVEDTGSGLLCKHLPTPPPAAYLCLPLVAHGEALGVLHLASTAQQPPGAAGLTPARQRLADAVARQLALSLANVRLRETLRIQSIRDPLTNLFNRRYMEEMLEREVRWGERKLRPVGVIMLDIDHFKQVNDTFGHDAGDAVLREVGALLQSRVRAVDVACRYGGEEFVLILPEASMDNTRRRAEQLREAAKRHHISYEGRAIGPLTISLGAAVFPDHGATAEAVIRAADAALYRAKVAGRDQVVVAE